MSAEPFTRTTFWAAVGISVLNDTHCIYIGGTPPPNVLQPPNDRKYITHTIFQFNAPKKVPFATIITNLKYAGVVPGDGFIPPRNPDNKYYTDLSDVDKVIQIIQISIASLSLDENLKSTFTLETISAETVAERRAKERPNINLHNYAPIVVIANGHRPSKLSRPT